MKTKQLLPSLLLASLLSLTSASAAIYTFSDFTRAAGDVSVTSTHDFVTNEGWSGTPPNETGATGNIYLTATVSWAATAGNIGTFNIRLNQNDDAGAARVGMGKTGGTGTGFEFITLNNTSDQDGPNPATARPTIAPVDTSTITSVTLVMRINQNQASITPSSFGGVYNSFDRWYATEGQQSDAMGFMWINPNLASTEASQFTPWAAWRSGNNNYEGVSFISDTDAVALQFSNIALYTGGDTPFTIPEPSCALLAGLGLLALLRRRR